MASSKWKSWGELDIACKGRRIVFWGASNWIERTLEHAVLEKGYVVDNSLLNQGIEYLGMDVRAPKTLLSERRDEIYIIISTAQYSGVIEELHEMGFIMGDEFCCSPLLNERRNRDELMYMKKQVLISSSQHTFDDKTGGGLYLVGTDGVSIEKIYSGKCRGLVRAHDGYLVVDMLRGLVWLDHNFKEIKSINLQPNCEPHGLCFDADNNRVFVGQPGRDSVGVYNLDSTEQEKEFFLSDKWRINGKDNHHVNDMCYHAGALFVSMFSLSGNWMNEVYDGGVVEFDVDSGTNLGPVVTDLWMPHSVQRFNGQLYVLDSMRSQLRTMNRLVLGEFSSFIRGLDFDGQHFVLGSTEHRYPERLRGISNNISLDTGFHIFNPESKMSRFIPLVRAQGIHDLLWYD